MPKVVVVYFTQPDVTGALARSLRDGLKTAEGVLVIESQIMRKEIVEGRFIDEEIFVELAQCDAIVFGTPTYMGGASVQFKAFADASGELWCEQEWAGKLAAGFTCGSAMNGDQTVTSQ